jgi:hypothetical protein
MIGAVKSACSVVTSSIVTLHFFRHSLYRHYCSRSGSTIFAVEIVGDEGHLNEGVESPLDDQVHFSVCELETGN